MSESGQNHQYPTHPSVSRIQRQRPPYPALAVNTTFGAPQQYVRGAHVQTPVSSVQSPALSVPSQSVGSPIASRGVPSTMSAYNPQEWSRGGSGGAVGGAYVPHSAIQQQRTRTTREMTGMEALLPSPPPPYSASSQSPNLSSRPFQNSPRIGSQASPNVEYSTPVSAATSFASGGSFGSQPRSVPHSTQQTSPSSFPPPPGHRDRSQSRTRGVLSNLSALAGRHHRSNEQTSQGNSSELFSRNRSESTSRPQPPRQDSFPPSYTPPGARRSVSVGVGTTVDQPRHVPPSGPSTPAWEEGMPLPGPPPGPPPGGSRSQSMNRITDRSAGPSSDPSVLAPVPTRAARGSNLGPIPPTPSDWVDEDAHRELARGTPANNSERPSLRLNIDTQNQQQPSHEQQLSIQSAIEPTAAQSIASSSSSGLSRMQQRREPSASIRERRSESRARSKEPQTAVEPANANPWGDRVEEARPANLVLTSTNNSNLGRRRHVKAAASPKSAAFSQANTSGSTSRSPESSRVQQSGTATQASASSQTVPPYGTTPPFSPDSQVRDGSLKSGRSFNSLTSKALPTPPQDSAPLSSSRSTTTGQRTPFDSRPTSGVPTSAMTSTSIARSIHTPSSGLNDFAQRSLDRYRVFLEKESSAATDRERLELFADFAVNESRLRRDRYSTAFESMGSDVLDLTRDLWRSLKSPQRTKTPTTINTNVSQPAQRPPSRTGAHPPQGQSSSSSPGSARFTPGTETESPGSAGSQGSTARAEPGRQNYKPSLSPIPSMAMSTNPSNPDDEDSRGRTASRWWEKSDEGSVGNGGRKIERTKRESKYMGLPREAREHLQWEDRAENSPLYSAGTPGPSNPYANLGPNEYPTEKVGSHEERTPSRNTDYTLPRTPQPPKLDVSRLITLPPPYPRHHPAVNNNHPELSSIRAILRTLNSTPEASDLRERYETSRTPPSAGLDPQSVSERRRQLRAQISNRVSAGEISFAEAAAEESAFEESEVKRQRNVAQQNFDDFQSMILSPLSSVYTDKIEEASTTIDALRGSLLDEAETRNPNQTQEEGDEQPELLEKVTLMKWFFEAREQLHKYLFDLQGESDEMYKYVILAPYKIVSNNAKIQEVESFFAKDFRDRKVGFEKQSLQRFESFLSTVEETVTKGVEAQLSAFWDIAPDLLAVVEKVPSDRQKLNVFDVLVPQDEIDENPSYYDFPLQYLYTLLKHAQMSTYQFIESQTNLFCLLHEVKTGVMTAGCRVLESQRAKEEDVNTSADESQENTEAARKAAVLKEEMKMVRQGEDERLTKELKERVDTVEEQWRTGLGNDLVVCKERVGRWLVEVGGWDDCLEE